MKGNRSPLLYLLVVLYGFCAAAQGVQFPIELDALRYDGENTTPTLYDFRRSQKVTVLRNKFNQNSFDVWASQSPEAPQLFVFTFEIIGVYSLVVKLLSIVCDATFSTTVKRLNVQLHFKTRDEAKNFHHDEIFAKSTVILSSKALDPDQGLWQSKYFDYELMDVLLHNGMLAKRVAENVTIERILARNKDGNVFSQFHIHSTNDEKFRTSNVIFMADYFNVSKVLQNRIVLGIWSNNRYISHICLVFADQAHAETFFKNISSYCNKNLNMNQDKAEVLYSADLSRVLAIH